MIKHTLIFLVVFIKLLGQADHKATRKTKILLANFKHLNGTLIGHQDGLIYGLNQNGSRWQGETGKSDLKILTGQHPAVAGWDLGKLEFGHKQNLDGVPFEKMKNLVVEHHQRGGISTFSWHPNNPADPQKTSWDKADSTIKQILTDKNVQATYLSWLDNLALFFKSLKDPKTGKAIPVIFRPWHEHTGSWFWWGANHCTPEEYISLWDLTQRHLIRKNKVHNLLYAYSTDKFNSIEHYLERYPGDKSIDLLGFDIYHRNAPESNPVFLSETIQMVDWLGKMGAQKNKPIAITETGLEKIPVANWWTDVLSPLIKNKGLSYVLFWRNGRPDHFYIPYIGQTSAADFLKFIATENVVLENKAAEMHLFKKKK